MNFRYKKYVGWRLLTFFWCLRPDSNRHTLSGGWFWINCVYQFRHSGTEGTSVGRKVIILDTFLCATVIPPFYHNCSKVNQICHLRLLKPPIPFFCWYFCALTSIFNPAVASLSFWNTYYCRIMRRSSLNWKVTSTFLWFWLEYCQRLSTRRTSLSNTRFGLDSIIS